MTRAAGTAARRPGIWAARWILGQESKTRQTVERVKAVTTLATRVAGGRGWRVLILSPKKRNLARHTGPDPGDSNMRSAWVVSSLGFRQRNTCYEALLEVEATQSWPGVLAPHFSGQGRKVQRLSLRQRSRSARLGAGRVGSLGEQDTRPRRAAGPHRLVSGLVYRGLCTAHGSPPERAAGVGSSRGLDGVCACSRCWGAVAAGCHNA